MLRTLQIFGFITLILIVSGCASSGSSVLGSTSKPFTVSRIIVVVPASVASGKLAASKSRKMANLLKSDLWREFKNKKSAAGATIKVSISRFYLADKGKAMLGIDVSHITGSVRITSRAGQQLAKFNVSESATGAMTGPVNMLIRAAIDANFDVQLSRKFARKTRSRVGR